MVHFLTIFVLILSFASCIRPSHPNNQTFAKRLKQASEGNISGTGPITSKLPLILLSKSKVIASYDFTFQNNLLKEKRPNDPDPQSNGFMEAYLDDYLRLGLTGTSIVVAQGCYEIHVKDESFALNFMGLSFENKDLLACVGKDLLVSAFILITDKALNKSEVQNILSSNPSFVVHSLSEINNGLNLTSPRIKEFLSNLLSGKNADDLSRITKLYDIANQLDSSALRVMSKKMAKSVGDEGFAKIFSKQNFNSIEEGLDTFLDSATNLKWRDSLDELLIVYRASRDIIPPRMKVDGVNVDIEAPFFAHILRRIDEKLDNRLGEYFFDLKQGNPALSPTGLAEVIKGMYTKKFGSHIKVIENVDGSINTNYSNAVSQAVREGMSSGQDFSVIISKINADGPSAHFTPFLINHKAKTVSIMDSQAALRQDSTIPTINIYNSIETLRSVKELDSYQVQIYNTTRQCGIYECGAFSAKDAINFMRKPESITKHKSKSKPSKSQHFDNTIVLDRPTFEYMTMTQSNNILNRAYENAGVQEFFSVKKTKKTVSNNTRTFDDKSINREAYLQMQSYFDFLIDKTMRTTL